MEARHVNAFIEATLETFQSMCGVTFHRKGAIRKVDGEIVDTDELLGIVGLSGDVRGAVMLTTELEIGRKLVSKFLMEDINEINCDLMDAWGELVNILAGAADAKIEELKVELALPSVVYGRNAKFYAKAGNPFVIIPMEIKGGGTFSLGVSMEIPKNKAAKR